MNTKKLFEKYKGCEAEYDGLKGVICGYDIEDELLIMAVIDSHGWTFINHEDTIITHKNNPNGYKYVDGSNISNLKKTKL